MREASMVARDAAGEFHILIDLVGHIDLEPIAPARRAGGIRPHVRIDDSLGLLPQVQEREGQGEIGFRRGANADLVFLSNGLLASVKFEFE